MKRRALGAPFVLIALLFSLHAAAQQPGVPEILCLNGTDGGMVCVVGKAGSVRPFNVETFENTQEFLKAELLRRAEAARKRLEAELPQADK